MVRVMQPNQKLKDKSYKVKSKNTIKHKRNPQVYVYIYSTAQGCRSLNMEIVISFITASSLLKNN
jgi:hypothetical protein